MIVGAPHRDTLTPAVPRPAAWVALGQGVRRQRRRVMIGLLITLSLLPVAYMLVRAGQNQRNIAYWDEIDTALALVVKLKEGMTSGEFLRDLFAVNNEHRMVTSRLLFATSYWLTGTVDFTIIGRIGNASIVGLVVLLVAAAGGVERRVRLGVLLAMFLFQLEHYENFLWSGSSIDHFQVVLLAAGAIVALARSTATRVLVGGGLALLATYTLAHGMVIWPVGAFMLWRAGDRRGLLIWIGLGAVAAATFLIGFKVNSAQSFAALSVEGLLTIAHYWLSILGAVPALGNTTAAPVLGGGLLVLLGIACRRGGFQREPVALPLTFFTLASMALIAVGRAELAHGVVFSRYYVLSAVAWALTLFMLLERHSHPRRPFQLLGAALPGLLAFNLVANHEFADEAASWLECRDRAATRFKQYGIDGRGPFTLHPTPAHATELLRKAEELGVYRMGILCPPRAFPAKAKESNRIVYYVDEMTVNARSAYINGWAAIPGERSQRGKLHVVLRSRTETLMFAAVTVTRPDVATGNKQPGWELAGFRFARRRDRLPRGDYQVGFLINEGGRSEYVMTAHRLNLTGEGNALLATGD